MKILKLLNKLLNKLFKLNNSNSDLDYEEMKMQLGKLLDINSTKINSSNINDYEFKVFSQWGEDGIINYLIKNLHIENEVFVEFGVENYKESNTRFLLKNSNWTGLIIDNSKKNIEEIKRDPIYWQYTLKAVCEFIDRDNINIILENNLSIKKIGLLSIDIDGNDYWIWEVINSVDPSIVIIEYNSILGIDKSLVVPYKKNFNRTKAHHSNIYYGASLLAINKLAERKGYVFVGCNSAGNNAFFIKSDLQNDKIKKKNIKDGYFDRKFRESRDKDYKKIYLSSQKEKEIISDLKFEEV